MKVILYFLLWCCLSTLASAAPVYRKWTRIDGKSVVAKVEKVEHGEVVLSRQNAVPFRVPLDQLSKTDHAYLVAEGLLKPKKKPGGKGADGPLGGGDLDFDPLHPNKVDTEVFVSTGPQKFAGLQFKRVDTPHFVVMAKGVSPMRAAENAEAIWQRMAVVHANFVKLLSKDKRVLLVLVDRKSDWESLLSWYTNSLEIRGKDREKQAALATWMRVAGTGMILGGDEMGKFGVVSQAATVNCDNISDKNKVKCPFRTHRIASHLHSLYVGKSFYSRKNTQKNAWEQNDIETPYWLTSGFGYFHEIDFCGRTETHQVDYDNYEKGSKEEGVVVEGKRFSEGSNWPSLIKRMAKREKPAPRLTTVLGAKVATLTPQSCAYVYAFCSFVLSTPELRAATAKTLADPDLAEICKSSVALAKSLGFSSVAECEAAWTEYILGSDFK